MAEVRYNVINPNPKPPRTRLIRAGRRFIRNFWVTQTLERMRIGIVGVFVMDLAFSVLVLIMLFTLLDIAQAWLTLWQVFHIFSWLLALTCAFIYDLGWVTAVLVVYIIAIIGDIIGFIWRIVELIDADLNTFYLVTLGIQTAAVGFLVIFDICAICILAIMRQQLFPKILFVTKVDQILMWQAWTSDINIVQAARERFHTLNRFLAIWNNLDTNEEREKDEEEEERRGLITHPEKRQPLPPSSFENQPSPSIPPPTPPSRAEGNYQRQPTFQEDIESLHYHKTPLTPLSPTPLYYGDFNNPRYNNQAEMRQRFSSGSPSGSTSVEPETDYTSM